MAHALRHFLQAARRPSTPRAVLYLLLITSTACQDRAEPATAPNLTPALMASVVTGAAAANLDAVGHFRLQGPPTTGPRQISQKEAEALAALWPKEFGPWIQAALEREHGGAIGLANLAVCGRTLYAESPFEPFDPAITADPMAAVAQRVVGPWWLVTLCGAAGAPEVSLGISAYATDLTSDGGHIHGPKIGGEWFSAEGIPAGTGEEFILTPERAAERMATKTARRIREVPRLVIPLRRDGFPNHPHWSLTLEADATVQGIQSTAQRHEARLYLGRRATDRSSTMAVAALDQPAEVPIHYVPNLRVGQRPASRQLAEIRARRRPDLPVEFEPVTVLPAR